MLPFRWELIDAYHYLPHFASLRGTEEVLPPSRLRASLEAALDGDGFVALLFHPFLLDSDERFDVLRWAVERVRERCAPCREVAQTLTAAG